MKDAQDINYKYSQVLEKCRFVSRRDEWFVEGSEAKCVGDIYDYSNYRSSTDKFNKGWSIFEGHTNETFVGYSGDLPRPDQETCSFSEFYIYDEFGNEISNMTIDDYQALLKRQNREEKLGKII